MPVVTGKTFVGGQVSQRGAVRLFQYCRIVVAGGGDIEAANTAVLERRRGIIRRAVNRGAQRRWCFNYVELVVRGNIEQTGLARVVNEPYAFILVPANL